MFFFFSYIFYPILIFLYYFFPFFFFICAISIFAAVSQNITPASICTCVREKFSLYVILFIYYTIVQTYSTFSYALHFVFLFFVLLQRILLLTNLASSAVSKIVVGKIRGKMDRICRSSGKSRSRSQGQGIPCDLEKKNGKGRDNGTKRRDGEQRVLIDAEVLILGNSFYFIRFFFSADPPQEDLENYHEPVLPRRITREIIGTKSSYSNVDQTIS